jgi:O-methyltransferase involved in polyketide biosynthesis
MRPGRPSRTAEQNAAFRAAESRRPPRVRLLNDPYAAQLLPTGLMLDHEPYAQAPQLAPTTFHELGRILRVFSIDGARIKYNSRRLSFKNVSFNA